MNYSNDPSMVRVDFFKESGKWYTTEEIKWDRFMSADEDGNIELIHDTFRRCVREQIGDRYQSEGCSAVCLEPYHEFAHPLMIKF